MPEQKSEGARQRGDNPFAKATVPEWIALAFSLVAMLVSIGSMLTDIRASKIDRQHLAFNQAELQIALRTQGCRTDVRRLNASSEVHAEELRDMLTRSSLTSADLAHWQPIHENLRVEFARQAQSAQDTLDAIEDCVGERGAEYCAANPPPSDAC